MTGPALFLAALFTLALIPGAVPASEPVVIAAYNIQNYLDTDRQGSSGDTPKPEDEIQAVVKIIGEINPDILGISEIGGQKDVDDLRARLAKAGLEFPYVEAVDGPEPRKLALFSRFPFASTQSSPDVPYDFNGTPSKVRRGFLDVTVQVNPDYQLRLIGVHLKSRRAVPEGEALIRRHEAHLLRERVETILEKDPEVNLIVYGDCNDTKNEPPIHEIVGARGASNALSDLWLKDSVGDRWTHYWKYADIYSRIDFIFVNRAIKPEVLESKSYVYRSPYWNAASDHRPIVAVIDPVNRK